MKKRLERSMRFDFLKFYVFVVKIDFHYTSLTFLTSLSNLMNFHVTLRKQVLTDSFYYTWPLFFKLMLRSCCDQCHSDKDFFPNCKIFCKRRLLITIVYSLAFLLDFYLGQKKSFGDFCFL